jgi:LysR family transcriptional regulator, transcriptional activator of the cysJI operon
LASVTLANLRLIRDVAHSHSVSRAAKVNGISQSAASQQIQELERELGIPIFDRSTRPLKVTGGGKLYLEYCRDALRRYEEFEAQLHKLKQEAKGTVRVAAIYSVGLSEMSQIEACFGKKYPDAELHVSYLRPERVYQSVAEEQVDLGLVSYAECTRDVIALPWRDEEMVVAVAPDHRLATRDSVLAEELDGEMFVGFDEDLPISREVERYLRDHKVEVDVVVHFDNLQTMKEAVAHGAGISIMPERVMQDDLKQGRLVAVPLRPATLFRPVRIIHRRRKVFTEAASGLLALLQGTDRPLMATGK